jgi:hypothetical protein
MGAVEIYEQITKYGFPFLLFLVLFGSYLDIWRWAKPVIARELELKNEIIDIKAVAAAREAAQQQRIDQLMDRMIEAAGLIEKSARRVGR